MSTNVKSFLGILAAVLALAGPPARATQPTSYFIYDESGHVIGEYDVNGNPVQEHVYLGDRPVAVVQGGASGTVDYVSADQLNTPRVITDSNQNVVWAWNSDPFGNGQPTGSLTYNLRFPGQYYDAETGHNYNYFRDYDPATGRYTESDPVGLYGGLNTYTYATDEPSRMVDPSGESWVVSGTYDPGEGDNTVYCNDEQALIALNNFNDYGCSALDDCAREHEGSHLKDAGGPSICIGNHGQKYVKNFDDAERLDSERRAFLVEIDCLKKKLRQMDCGDSCKKIVQKRIDDIQNHWLPQVANGTYGKKP